MKWFQKAYKYGKKGLFLPILIEENSMSSSSSVALIGLRRELLTNQADSESEFFTQIFLDQVQDAFKQRLKGMDNRFSQTPLLALEAIVRQMTSLKTSQDNAGPTVADLLQHINSQKRECLEMYAGTLESRTVEAVKVAFDSLEIQVQDYISRVNAINIAREEKKAAEIVMTNKQATKQQFVNAGIICACICWCPIEYVLTCGNLFGIGGPSAIQDGGCREMTQPVGAGNWSIWAPLTSISNLNQGIKDQEAKKEPVPMVMR
jgi:hypothetical protein